MKTFVTCIMALPVLNSQFLNFSLYVKENMLHSNLRIALYHRVLNLKLVMASVNIAGKIENPCGQHYFFL